MKPKINLVWNAYRFDINTGTLQIFNVINDDLIDTIKNSIDKKELVTYKDLKEIVNRWAIYYYWSKAEHEMLIYDLFDTNDERGKKIDVYWQIKINMDRLVDYIIKEMQLDLC